jgi:hypothetical protein
VNFHHHHHLDPALERLLLQAFSTLITQGDAIMSTITDYGAKVTAFQNQISTALDDIKTEISSLNDKITQLQNSPGPISTEDQATLDAAQTQIQGLVTKAQALDSINPPPAPPTT